MFRVTVTVFNERTTTEFPVKTAVIVSYHFPPCGGKAVQRSLKLVKYLPDFGWRPVVLAMPAGEKGVPVDDTLLDDIPAETEVHRPGYFSWWRLVPHDIRKHLYRPAPDKYRAWADGVRGELAVLLRETGADALVTTSPTHSVQLLGLSAKRMCGIPWVADFRDPWSGHPDFPSKHRADEMLALETAVLSEADAVVGVYPKILRDFGDRAPAGKLHLIENGFDEDDFRLVDWSAPAPPGPLVMGYNGTVSDFHDPAPLLDAVDAAVASGRIDPAGLRIVFTTNEGGMKRFSKYTGLRDAGVLDVREYLPHAESLRELSRMDVSLHLLNRGRDIYPGKIFEYFRLGNPILSVQEPGDDLDALISGLDAGIVADCRDPAAITGAVRDLMERKRTGNLSRFEPPREAVARFSRRGIAERYAALLDDISRPDTRQTRPAGA